MWWAPVGAGGASGGGGRRVLGIAAREADIISVNPNLNAGAVTPEVAQDMSAERVAEKIGWIEEAAKEAGRDPGEIELQVGIFLCRITDSAEEAKVAIENVASMFSADPQQVAESPAILVGSLEQCVEILNARRERYGISYVTLGGDVTAAAPLVARLAGT